MTMKTEDEARKCWCPFARVLERESGGNTQVRNRVAKIEGENAVVLSARLVGAQCIASECMAWRWSVSPETAARRSTPNALGLWNADEMIAGGYCGLAGAGGEGGGK